MKQEKLSTMKGKSKHFRFEADFLTKKISANDTNTAYTVGLSGEVASGTPEIRWKDVVYVKDKRYIWTHGQVYGKSSGGLTPEMEELINQLIEDMPTKADKDEVLNKTDIADWAKASEKPSYTANEVGALPNTITHLSGDIPTSEKGANGGVATLGSDGKVPSSQLPSYVDDVLEYADDTYFPRTGEEGKIYIDLSTNKTYRWGGSTYVEISASIALGETSSTAYAGDKGKKLAEDIATIKGDYLTSADKTNLSNAISTLENNQDALETHLSSVERTVANVLNEFDFKYNK